MPEENETLRGQQATDEGQEEVKTYTQEEVDKLLQSEADKRVSEALNTAKEKWEKDFEDKLKKEKDEAAKMAKMSAQERSKAELDKERAKFEKEKLDFERQKLELELTKELAKEGLSTDFSSFLLGVDAEESLNNLKTFKEVYEKDLEDRVKERLGGEVPKSGQGAKVEDQAFDLKEIAKNNRLIKE